MTDCLARKQPDGSWGCLQCKRVWSDDDDAERAEWCEAVPPYVIPIDADVPEELWHKPIREAVRSIETRATSFADLETFAKALYPDLREGDKLILRSLDKKYRGHE
jgi:hypothetical protein